MALSDVTAASVRAAMAEFDEVGRDAFLAKYGFRRARGYFLRDGGTDYDSKAIVGAAHGVARPDLGPLRAEDFSGGDASVGRLLTQLGFVVTEPKKRNPTWTRDELILALDHYLSYPGSAHDDTSEEVLRLSTEINALAQRLGMTGSETLRNANGVSMKLLNFRAHDPEYVSRGRKGLTRGNKLEAELWSRFADDREVLREAAQAIRNLLLSDQEEASVDEAEVAEAEEGRLVTRVHRQRERNRDIVRRKKASVLKQHGRLACEACGFDFAERYGDRGKDFIECHHTKPVSTLRAGERTKLADLALLCANCHRMIHVRAPWLTVEELRAIVVAPLSHR